MVRKNKKSTGSAKYKYNITDYKKILRGAVIALSGAFPKLPSQVL